MKFRRYEKRSVIVNPSENKSETTRAK